MPAAPALGPVRYWPLPVRERERERESAERESERETGRERDEGGRVRVCVCVRERERERERERVCGYGTRTVLSVAGVNHQVARTFSGDKKLGTPCAHQPTTGATHPNHRHHK